MSHKLKFTVGVIFGISMAAASLAWRYAARPLSGSNVHPVLACASDASATSSCKATTRTVIHLGTIVVAPTPGEERYAFSLASPRAARSTSPLAKEGNISG